MDKIDTHRSTNKRTRSVMPPLALQGRLPRSLHDGPTHDSNNKQNQQHPGGRFGEALREDLREDEEGELVAEGEEEAGGGF